MSTLKVDGIRSNSATSDAITLASNGTCTANITNNLSNRNLIINGAMQVAQRGTSSTSAGYQTVDRFQLYFNRTGVTNTQSQQSLSSSDTGPYEAGFRKYFRAALSGAGTANTDAEVGIFQRLEAQDIANSGWNYTSSSSYITLQFWFRCSTNQTFYCYLESQDGTGQSYPFSFTASANNTWTKITKTIPGNSNLQFDNDANYGLQLAIIPFFGTDLTNNKTLDQWSAFSASNRLPDMASTWLTAGASTFDLTGVQLEVGDFATDFEHRSFADELDRCFRYCQVFDAVDGEYNRFAYANAASGSSIRVIFPLMREMRAKPSVAFSGAFQCPGVGSFNINNVIMETNTGSRKVACLQHGSVSVTSYQTYQFNANNDTSAKVTYSAEL